MLGRAVDDFRPEPRGGRLVVPIVAAALGRVPALVVAELQQVLGVGVDAEEGHDLHLVLVPGGRVLHAAERFVLLLGLVPGGHHAVGHLLAREDVAARQSVGREVELHGQRGRVLDLVEPDRGHGGPGAKRVLRKSERRVLERKISTRKQ